MKRLSALMLVGVLCVLAFPGGAVADPGGPNLQQPVLLTCSDGTHPTVNPGTATNQGRVAWVTTTNGVYVTAYLAFTDDTGTFVLFNSKKGLQAHQTLVTCSGLTGEGDTVTAKGFFTPHH